MRINPIYAGLVAAICGVAGYGLDVWAAGAAAPAVSTAPQVTFVGEVRTAAGIFLWRYFTTTAGKPLYTFDADDASGKPTCVDACAKRFTAYLAAGNVKAESDWSLIAVGQGQQQWAYKGHPLYYFSGRDPSPDTHVTVDNRNKAQYLDPRMLDPSSDFFSPEKGWRRAAFRPEEHMPIPAGIELKSMDFANGYGFVDSTNGMPLYVMKTAPKNATVWTPKYASDLAVPMGDFTVVVREDGVSQWAYKGQPLYSYKDDYLPEDTNGIVAQSDARIALAYQNFMPSSVRIDYRSGRGPLLVTSNGMTLYSLGRGAGRGGRRGAAVGYGDAKLVSIRACAEDCLNTWTPVLAGPNDQGAGFWEVQTRPDGSKQWAYRGGALYTYKGDKKPGDTEGIGERVLVYGDADGSNYDLVDLAGGNRGPDPRAYAGAGFYWHTIAFTD